MFGVSNSGAVNVDNDVPGLKPVALRCAPFDSAEHGDTLPVRVSRQIPELGAQSRNLVLLHAGAIVAGHVGHQHVERQLGERA